MKAKWILCDDAIFTAAEDPNYEVDVNVQGIPGIAPGNYMDHVAVYPNTPIERRHLIAAPILEHLAETGRIILKGKINV